MKKLFFFLSLFIGLSLSFHVNAQDFKSKQKAQERTIKAAYKAGKVTENEYYKLMEEQEDIKEAIAKYQADDMMTPREKNAVHDKLVRAEKRLRRYKTNGEVY